MEIIRNFFIHFLVLCSISLVALAEEDDRLDEADKANKAEQVIEQEQLQVEGEAPASDRLKQENDFIEDSKSQESKDRERHEQKTAQDRLKERESDGDCKSHYRRKIEKRVTLHERINKYFIYTGTASIIFAFINPIVSGLIVGVHFGSMLTSSIHGSEKGNIFNLHYLETDEGKKLFKDAVEIDPDVSNVEIYRIIEHGFESNHFCKKLPRLMTLDDVRDYVRERVRDNKQRKGDNIDVTPVDELIEKKQPMKSPQSCDWTIC